MPQAIKVVASQLAARVTSLLPFRIQKSLFEPHWEADPYILFVDE